SGFYDLDAMTSGFQPSDLVIIAARPSMGKTAFVLNIAQNCAVQHGIPVAVFSLEMSKESLVMRMLCAEAEIDANRLRTGHMHTSDWTRLAAAMGRLGESPIYIDDSALVNALEIRAKCRRLKAEMNGLGMVIIDYIQLMQGRKQSDNRVQEVSEISRSLKTLAREIGVPVIALSQLSRAVESRQNKRPMLSDLRESGCLSGDTKIFLPDSGSYERIDSLVGKRDFNVLALNPTTWKLEPRKVLNAFCTGEKPVYRIITRLNRTILATANHKFRTLDGWVRLDELAIGTTLALPRHLPNPIQKGTSLSRDELALLGSLIADGCTLARHAIQFTSADEDMARKIADLASRVFPNKITPRIKKERNWYQVYLASADHLTHGRRNAIAEWMDNLGVFDLRSWEKEVPSKVFESSDEDIAIFLRHLWSADGTVFMRSGEGRGLPRILYATSSEKLARDVQSLLIRIGICGRIKRVSQKQKGRDQFHVDLTGSHDQVRFLTKIGIEDNRRQDIVCRILAQHLSTKPNTNRDLIPIGAWRGIVEPARQACGMTSRDFQASIGTAYCGSTLFKSGMSRDRAARVATVVKSDHLQALAASDVYWDAIVSIEEEAVMPVYDLTVEEHHNFVANDIVVHNSI
ncbi:MAG: replicative DNA helicase, partial [Cyanobacteria bacterium]|nr:replicative DNA helicase [Cyanobacteriota bacterium]